MIVKMALRAVLILLPLPTTIAVPILGGELTEANELPSTVAIRREGGCEKDVCGGAIISADTIVTAAHCSESKETKEQVRAGSLVSFNIQVMFKEISNTTLQDRLSGGILVDVLSIHNHPEYNFLNGDNDISVWKLSTPIPKNNSTIRYAELTSEHDYPYIFLPEIIVGGWYV